MNTIKKALIAFTILLLSLAGSAHAEETPLTIDEFHFSSTTEDRLVRGGSAVGDPVFLFWSTSGASSCESSAKVQRGTTWTDVQMKDWSTKKRETSNGVGVRLIFREATRYYLKCFNETGQESVEKWVEVAVGNTNGTQRLAPGSVVGLRSIIYDASGGPITRDELAQDIVRMQTDQRINFAWRNTLPSPLLSSNAFTVEWKGDVVPRKTGMYSFAIVSDDAGALWINDELIVSGDHANDKNQDRQEFSSSQKTYLEVGRTYHIRMKTRHARGNAIAQLWWTDPMGKKEIIPSSYLRSEAAPRAMPPGKGNGVTATYAQYMALEDPYTPRISKTQKSIATQLPASFQNREPFAFDAIYEGALTPRISTFYRFYIQADGGVEFSLRGEDQDITVNQKEEGNHEYKTLSVFLEAGKPYPISFTYRQSKGVANAQVLWSNAIDGKKESIPQSQLSSKPIVEKKPTGQGRGVVGTYFNGEHFEQQAFQRLDKTINFRWGFKSPKPGIIRAPHYSVRWEGTIEAPTTDFYQFSSTIDDHIVVRIAGEKILDTTNIRAGSTQYSIPILLKQGDRYPIKVEYRQRIETSFINLMWATPTGKRELVPFKYLYQTSAPGPAGTGLRGDYFAGENFEKFVARHPAEYIGFDWDKSAPDALVPADHFSVRWTGWIEPPVSDTYTLYTFTDDGVRLWISEKDQDGIAEGAPPLIDQWKELDHIEHKAQKYLEAGHRYFIKMEYFEKEAFAAAQLRWSRKGNQSKVIVPRGQLYPEPYDTQSASLTGVGPRIGNGNGLRGDYYRNQFGSPLVSRTDQTVNFDWRGGSPDANVPTNDFSVRWTGWIEPIYSDTHTLYTFTDDGVRLWISDKDQNDITPGAPPLIDSWSDQDHFEHRAQKYLEAGHRYFIRIEYFEHFGEATALFLWESPHIQKSIVPQSQLYSNATSILAAPGAKIGKGTGLRGRYYQNKITAGQNILPFPLAERIDPVINFSWGYDQPHYSVPSDNFSVRWDGFLQPQYDEEYTFFLSADDNAALWISDTAITDQTQPIMRADNTAAGEYAVTRTLQAGKLYYIRVTYFDDKGPATINLSWQSPHTLKTTIPFYQLYPPSTPVIGPGQ